ncbi:MAG: IS200/IS605 family transposase [Planctomycetaceae bacterium]|jgi:REP element-mobilizing transposase RayT|nr:IS200/IS605 family transposase [Planctomycetaceae bacterium]
MANTYTQIHIHAIFAVQNRQSLITSWKEDLYKYITGILQNNGHKMLCIGGMPDHIHIFFGMRPTQSLSELMQTIKSNSSKWINEQNLVMGRFSWQEGYSAFSYARSQIPIVIRYVNNQEQHHENKTVSDECIELMNLFEVDYDKRYVFKNVE